MSNSREAGLQAEERALQFLQAQGLHCVARNFSSHRGEIDLVMQDSDTLVFVEVRFRRHGGFGSAAESVTGSKQQRIIRAASHFLNRSRQWRDSACRFDVLAISGAGQQTIDWIRDAFRADYSADRQRCRARLPSLPDRVYRTVKTRTPAFENCPERLNRANKGDPGMRDKTLRLTGSLLLLALLQGCAPAVLVGGSATGTSVAHDRRSAGSTLDDQIIELKVLIELQQNDELKTHSSVSATSYNYQVLLTGQADDANYRDRVGRIAAKVPKVNKVVNEIQIGPATGIAQSSRDAYLTTKVKLELFSVDLEDFDPSRVKVVTEQATVYLMGLLTVQEANAVVEKVRFVDGVQKVVKVFEYVQ